MEICALMLSLKKDEEVLMPSYNYNTTASSFVRTGCKVRYCDIDKKNLMPTFHVHSNNISIQNEIFESDYKVIANKK